MKKHLIIASAFLLAIPALTGCIENIEPDSEPEYVETTTVTTEPPKTVTEIDPFGDVDFTYFHETGGEITDKSTFGGFGKPQEVKIGGTEKNIQLMRSRTDGIKKCHDLGCQLSIYREELNPELKEDDTVTLHLYLKDSEMAEKDLPAYLEQEYGIHLKQTTKEIKVHFEEEPVTEIDPFKDGTVSWTVKDGQYKETDKLSDCTGCKSARMHEVYPLYTPSLAEGQDLEHLYAGDKVKYTVMLKSDGNEYVGEAANQYLSDHWMRVHFTQTEKEFTVLPENNKGRFSTNVNVNLTRPADWKEIAADKTKFNKYDFRNIDGSTATIPITAELHRQFCGIPDDELEYYLDHNTTGPAYENLILGKANKNLLFVTEPSEEEKKLAADNNVELDVTQVALDGFVFITHKDNPVDSLTVWQIQSIYSGQITNWSQVGGNDEEIVAYQREPNSGSQTVMENMVMNGIEMMPAPKSPVVPTMGGLVDSIASYQNKTCSIGYSFYYYINNLYQNADIKVLKINGISPDNENLISKAYPFSSGYFAVTRKGGDAKAEEIKQYLLTDEGQELIRLAGYCPVK